MKRPIFSLFLLATLAGSLALAQERSTARASSERSAKERATTAAEAVDPTLAEFDKLNPEVADKIRKLVNEASGFLSGIRLQEALAKLTEADILAKGKLFVVKNLIGAAFTKIRMFPEAREAFEEALKLHPHSFQAKFNLAEIEFVEAAGKSIEGKDAKASWAKAQRAFEELQKSPSVDEATKKLMQFKVVITLLKQDKKAEAEEIVKTFSYIDDEPIYQMAHAALEFDKDDKAEAQSWIDTANRIWGTSPQVLTVYMDSFIEVGWVESLLR